MEEIGRVLPFIIENPFFLTRTVTRGKNAGHIDVTAWFLLRGNSKVMYPIQEKDASLSKWMPVDQLFLLPEEANIPRAARKFIEVFQGKFS